METALITGATAVSAVALSILPGSLFAAGIPGYSGAMQLNNAAYGSALQFEMRPFAYEWELNVMQGTAANVKYCVVNAEESGLDAMMRVAHTLASRSIDIDADIAQIVDDSFWDLI